MSMGFLESLREWRPPDRGRRRREWWRRDRRGNSAIGDGTRIGGSGIRSGNGGGDEIAFHWFGGGG